MKALIEYINEALNPQTGIGAFDWCTNCTHVAIDNIVQQLPGLGFKPTTGHVQRGEYKITHNGACLTIGVRPKATGEGTRQPSAKIFVRTCGCGMISVVEKYLNIDGDGKATYKVLRIEGERFIWEPVQYNELPQHGNIEDTIEFSTLFIKKIMARLNRYTK